MTSDWAGAGAAHFASTRWSVVLAAGGQNAPAARDALEQLCAHSWYPLYAYLRRQGHAAEAAQDLTQGFFANLLERGDIGRADRERGRFRSFLLSALKNYVAGQGSRARAQKRGGGRRELGLAWPTAEGRFMREPTHTRTPENLYAASWARALLDSVMGQLEAEYTQRGKRELFQHLASCLGGSADALPYGEIARILDASEGSVKVAVHRMRARFRQLLHNEIKETLAEGEDVEAEIRDLFDALAGA